MPPTRSSRLPGAGAGAGTGPGGNPGAVSDGGGAASDGPPESLETDVGLPVVAIGFGVGVVVGFPEGAGTSGEESPSEPHHAAVPPAPAHASELAMFPAFDPSSQSHGSPVEDQ